MRMQRAWLRGERSGRVAVVLQFAAGGARFAEALAPGAAFDGALAFWPGALPRRALVHRRGPAEPIAAVHGATPIAAFLSDHAAALARMPWLESDLAALAGVVPLVDGEDGFRVADAAGHALPLGGRDHRLLFAVSGGHPIDLVGEWDGRRLRPLTAVADGRYHPLAGRDDG
jgi:hypothetical protein